MSVMLDRMQKSEAAEHVTRIVKASGTSFYWAMRVLPPDRREAMYAVYAFCREVDDIADEPAPEDDKRRRLAAWRGEIARIYDGKPRTVVGQALKEAVARYGMERDIFLSVIEGMEIDAAARLRIADMAALETYCDHVACAVGRLSNKVFGVDDEHGEPVAVSLGHALQLTNILRDLKEDAAIDRLYLPRDRLAAHGIASDDPEAVLAHPALPAVCEEIAEICARRYREAESALAACDARVMRPAIMMMHVYRNVFGALRRRGWERLDCSVSLPPWQKLWILVRYGVV
jgi:presqualene diphosphate synthase